MTVFAEDVRVRDKADVHMQHVERSFLRLDKFDVLINDTTRSSTDHAKRSTSLLR